MIYKIKITRVITKDYIVSVDAPNEEYAQELAADMVLSNDFSETIIDDEIIDFETLESER